MLRCASLVAILLFLAASTPICAQPFPLVILNGHQGVLTDAAFSRDSRLLATRDYTGAIRVWDLQTRRAVQALQDDPFYDRGGTLPGKMAFSPDRKILISATRAWRLDTGAVVEHPAPVEVGPTAAGDLIGELRDAAPGTKWTLISPDRRLAVSGTTWCGGGPGFFEYVTPFGQDQVPLEVRHFSNGRLGKRYMDLSELGLLPAVRGDVAPDGRYLALGGGGSARVWDLSRGRLRWITPSSSRECAVAFDPLGRWLAVGRHKGPVRLCEASRGTVLQQLAAVGAYSIEISYDGRYLDAWSEGSDGGIDTIWDLERRRKRVLTPPETGGSWSRLPLHSSDGRWMVFHDTLTSVDGRKKTQKLGRIYGRYAFSPHSRLLACVVRDGISLWDLSTGRRLRTILVEASEVDFVDEDHLMVFSLDSVGILTLDGKRWTRRVSLQKTNYEAFLAFNRSSTILVTSTRAPSWTRLRSLRTGRQLAFMDLGESGDWIATTGDAWDASPRVRALVRMRGPEGLQSAARFRRPGLIASFLREVRK